jgi:serine/threonine protein kinase
MRVYDLRGIAGTCYNRGMPTAAASAFDGPLIGGRWRLGPKLGHGAQADTYLAREEDPAGPAEPGARARNALGIVAAREADKKGPIVVVKRLIPRGTWKSFDLFEREAKVLAQLRHPGVPRHIATIEDPPGTFNLVMERMAGEDLRAVSLRRRLSETELVDVMTRALEILDYLHTRAPAVVHRDIKPSNLVLAPDGKVALVDFGGVLDAAREKGGSTMVGTFGYMAPEQLHGQAVPATDIYALGATVVALAGGIEPEDVPRKGLAMDLARHLPSIDPGLRAALTAMTAPDPEQRPQNAREVLKLLARPKSTTKALAVRPTSAAARPRQRSLRKLFPNVSEPLGTALRLSVLAFGAAGWVGMVMIRLQVAIMAGIFSIIFFPAFRKIRGIGEEVDLMLKEGQEGFGDIARRAIGRTSAPALPPGDPR